MMAMIMKHTEAGTTIIFENIYTDTHLDKFLGISGL